MANIYNVGEKGNTTVDSLIKRSGHMVRNKSCWEANNTVALPKQKSSHQSSPTFLCFESSTALFASQRNLSVPCDRQRAYSIYN